MSLIHIDKTTLHHVLWYNQEWCLANFELIELSQIHSVIIEQLEEGLI